MASIVPHVPVTLVLVDTTESAVLQKARERAADWFEEDLRCVHAEVLEATPSTAGRTFKASVKVSVQHHIERPYYGFPRCRICKKEVTA